MQNIEEVKSKIQQKHQILDNIQNLDEQQFEQAFKECQELYEILQKLEKEKNQCNQTEFKVNQIDLNKHEKQNSNQISNSIQKQQIQQAHQSAQNRQIENELSEQQQLAANNCFILNYQNQNNSLKQNLEILNTKKQDDASKTVQFNRQGEQIDLQQNISFKEQDLLIKLNQKESINILYSQNNNLNMNNNGLGQKTNQDQNFFSNQKNLNQDLGNHDQRQFTQNMNNQFFGNSFRQQQQNYSEKTIQNYQNQNYLNVQGYNFSSNRNFNQSAQLGGQNYKRRFNHLNSPQQLQNELFEYPQKKRCWNDSQFYNQSNRQQITVLYDKDRNYNIFDSNNIQKDINDQFQLPMQQNEKKEHENYNNQDSKQQIESIQNQQIQPSFQNLNVNLEINQDLDNKEIQEDNKDLIKLTRKYNDMVIQVNQQEDQLKKKGFVKDSLCFIYFLKYLINPIAGVNIDAFSEENYQIRLKKDKGISVHRYVADLFRDNQYILKLCDSLSQNQQTFLQHYVQVIKDYISIRDMKVTGIEKEFNSEGERKRYDLLAENEKEALIFDWKFTQQDAYYKILVDHKEHFLDQVRVLQQIYTNKIVRICILPLQEIKQIKFIEFEYKDIQQIQMNQAKDPIFQKSMLKMFLEDLKREPKFKDEYSYNAQGQAIKIQQHVEKIIQEADIKQIEYYIDLNNSDELLFKQNSQNSFKKITNKKQFDQFYYIHLLLCQKLSQNNNSNNHIQLNEQILNQIQKTMKDTNQVISKNDNLNEEIISSHKQQEEQQQQQLPPQSLQQSPQSFKSLPNLYQQSPESYQWSPQSFQQLQNPFQQSPPPVQYQNQIFEQIAPQNSHNPVSYNSYQYNQNYQFDYRQRFPYSQNRVNQFKQQGNYQNQFRNGNQYFFDKY
ncbi:hypothetical protein ABPG74_011267 [Tetrahymena malaccensis]